MGQGRSGSLKGPDALLRGERERGGMNTRFEFIGTATLFILAVFSVDAAATNPEARQCAPELAPSGLDNGGRTVISDVPWVPIQAGEKVVYGTDDRRDVYQETNSTIKAWAGAVCALVSTAQLAASGGGWHLATSAYRHQGYPPCSGEPFANQPTAAFCTGFLVGPDIVATAGHCFDSTDISSGGVRFVFGFDMANATTPELDFAADQVYTGVALLGHQLDHVNALDYSIIQLDRMVTAPGAVPLPIRRTGTVPLNTAVGVIGHPSGLPKKIAFGAATRVASNTATGYFVSNLDSYGGNSGSPVFNAATGVVEGILVRGNNDFNVNGSCFVSNVLPDNSTDAEEVSKATTFAQFVPVLGGKGEIALDHALYSCTDIVAITVTDTNAAGTTQQVTVTSGAGDTETVTLTQTSAGSHTFTGSIPLTAAPPTAQNGTLSVADGTTISAVYADQNNGAGAQENVTATAQADCAAPVISNVTFTALSMTSEWVRFQTSEAVTGLIAYSTAACHDAGAQTATTPSGVSHSATLTGLTPGAPHFVSITATDAAGNTATSDNGGACHTFTSGATDNAVVDGGFELGNPNPAWTQGSTAYGSVICNGANCGLGNTTGPFAGSWWAWFGGVEDTAENGYIAQSITIPAAASAVLTFQLEIPAVHVPGSLRVLMDGTQLFQVTQADAAAYAAYREVVVSVSAYADGTPHLLRFEGHTDGTGLTGVTNFFVDNVAIAVSNEGESPVQVTVPGVQGLAQAAAAVTLQMAGLVAQVASQQCSDIFAAGQAISQNPAANTAATQGSTVSLVVSTGPCTTPVEGETAEGEGEGEGEGEAAQVAQALYDAFASADSNHDGFLNIAEAKAFQPELTTAEFMSIDYNRDGKITQDELAGYLNINTGCTCNKSGFSPGGLQKRLGDFFLGGLSLAMLILMATRRAR